MAKLKVVWYGGTWERFNGRVAYVIDGTSVYFTSIPVSDRKYVTSTINAAERIVEAISEVEHIDWRYFAFHDIQTWRGYEGKRRGYYAIDRLTFQSRRGQPVSPAWTPVARWAFPRCMDQALQYHDDSSFVEEHRAELEEEGRKESAQLSGVPAHILELFQPFFDPSDELKI